MSRPTNLTEELIQKATNAVRAGMTYERAAAYAGINEREFYRYKAWGQERPDSIYGRFCQELEKAECDAELRNLMQIEQAAHDGQWQAAAWRLERRYPDRYGRRFIELTGAGGSPLFPAALSAAFAQDPEAIRLACELDARLSAVQDAKLLPAGTESVGGNGNGNGNPGGTGQAPEAAGPFGMSAPDPDGAGEGGNGASLDSGPAPGSDK